MRRCSDEADVIVEPRTPAEVELTPQEVTTLVGDNNVWSDGGNVSLTYKEIANTIGY